MDIQTVIKAIPGVTEPQAEKLCRYYEMLMDWNSRMKEEGKANMLIAPKEVIRRVKARRRENRPTPKNLREKARLQASWN